MRRVLFAAFLSIAAFTALANNLLEATAPTIAAEVGDLESRSGKEIAELARLSELPNGPFRQNTPAPVNSTVSQAQPLFVSTWAELMISAGHQIGLLPEVGADPNEPTGATAEMAKPAAARLQVFLTAVTEVPKAIFSRRTLEPIPDAPVFSSEETIAVREHNSYKKAAVTVAEDEPHESTGTAAASRLLPVFLTAWVETPSATFQKASLVEAPSAPFIETSQTVVAADHVAFTQGSDVTDTQKQRVASENVAARSNIPTFIAAMYEVPMGIFQRARFVAMPEEPKMPEPETPAAGDHIAFQKTDIVPDEERRQAASTDVTTRSLPVFVTAAYEVPTAIFQRARLVAEPEAPIMPEPQIAAIGDHLASQKTDIVPEIRSQTASAETARRSSSLPVFLTAAFEAPTAIFQRARLVAEPEAPIMPEPQIAAVGDHVALQKTDIVPDEVRSPASTEVTQRSSSLPMFVSAIYEVPSAIIERIRLYDAPAAPATTATAVSRNESPALITASSDFSRDLLKPMVSPVEAAPLLSESSVATTSHSSKDGLALTTQFDRAIDSNAEPLGASEKAPVLISGKPEFSMDLLRPMNSSVLATPFVKFDKQEIIAALAQDGNYCDPNWVGPPIRFSQTVELKLEDLINQLHQRFGVNFIIGKGIGDLPMNIKAGSIPWNVLLKSQLFLSGVRARCIDQNTIELIENKELPTLQDMADVETRFVKLKFLQRTGGGTVDLANRSQGGQNGGQGGGCGGNNQGGTSGSVQGGGQGGGQQGQTAGQLSNNKFDKLVVEIEKILGLRSMSESSGGPGQGAGAQQTEVVRTNRFVTQIPGRNILAIRATKEEHELIDQIIVRADRPPFQVVIKGLVYTANQDRLRDIGVQTTITGGTADNRTSGGIFGDTLGTGTLFDFSTIIGTFDFNVQATAFQQNGIISVKSRPFATVIDGLCTTLDVGRQLPIIIDSTLGGQGDVVFVNAANNLAVTPYVIDDDNGNPMAVTLELRLTANDIDSSISARGIPAISARSIQTQLLLGEDKTAILGGFTVDSDSRTFRKTPGLGDIPIIGELFRRRIRDTRVNRLYFAVSVSVIPFPDAIRPVDVPGATTDPPSITPEMKMRADKAEPKQVPEPKKTPNEK